MKTKEELNALKEELETLNRKLAELTDEEMAQVAGGMIPELFSKVILKRIDPENAGLETASSDSESRSPIRELEIPEFTVTKRPN